MQKLLKIQLILLFFSLFSFSFGQSDTTQQAEKVVVTKHDGAQYVGDFEKHLLSIQNAGGKKAPIKPYITQEFDAWATQKLIEYEDSQLEKKYPDFRNLIKEYRDGILVFEIMQNEIWNKAAKDTTGIKAYFEAHRDDFTYPLRYKGQLYKCKNKEIASRVYELLQSDTLSYGQIQQMVNENSQLNVTVKSQAFSTETTEEFKKGKKIRKFKTGINKVFEHEGSFYVFKVEEILKPRKREFSEAKGLVTAAYQNQLEKEWLASLREKYEIEIVHDHLYKLGEHQ